MKIRYKDMTPAELAAFRAEKERSARESLERQIAEAKAKDGRAEKARADAERAAERIRLMKIQEAEELKQRKARKVENRAKRLAKLAEAEELAKKTKSKSDKNRIDTISFIDAFGLFSLIPFGMALSRVMNKFQLFRDEVISENLAKDGGDIRLIKDIKGKVSLCIYGNIPKNGTKYLAPANNKLYFLSEEGSNNIDVFLAQNPKLALFDWKDIDEEKLSLLIPQYRIR